MWVVDWKKLQMQACRLRSHTVDVTPPQAATKIMAGMAEQQTEWRNQMADEMVKWREWQEWRNGRKNGRMVEWREWLHTYSCSLSENKSFDFLTSLSWLERLVGQKKLDGESCYVARRYLIFPFLASSDFRRRSRMSDRNGYIRTIYGTHRQRRWRRHTLIF